MIRFVAGLLVLGFAAGAAAAPARKHKAPRRPAAARSARPSAPKQAASVPGVAYPLTPPVVHSYWIGTYVDPADPDVRHQAHVVDRLERASQWDLSATGREIVRLGPGVQIPGEPMRDAASAAAEAKLVRLQNEHKAYSERLGAESAEMTNRLKEMTAKLEALQNESVKLEAANAEIKRLRARQKVLLQELERATEKKGQAIPAKFVEKEER